MVKYISIINDEFPNEPNLSEIAKQLEKEISTIEKTKRVKLISACFLGKHDVLDDDEEDSLFAHAIRHNIAFDFMLFFESISRERLC